MVFNNKMELLMFLKKEYVTFLGSGSQGRTYFNKKNKQVFKIMEQFFDDEDDECHIDYTPMEFMRFSGISNNTYIFSDSIVYVGDEVVGYTMRYGAGKLLSSINPMLINLDKFIKSINQVVSDNAILAKNGVKTYDVPYNILYGNNGFKIIDTVEYYNSDEGYDAILKNNNDAFNWGIMYFLVDGYFDDFVINNSELKDMYLSNGIDIQKFILLYRKYLSEYIGNDIVKLNDAKRCLNRKLCNKNYERSYR